MMLDILLCVCVCVLVAELLYSVQCTALWFHVVVFSGHYCLPLLNKMNHFGTLWWVFEAPRID